MEEDSYRRQKQDAAQARQRTRKKVNVVMCICIAPCAWLLQLAEHVHMSHLILDLTNNQKRWLMKYQYSDFKCKKSQQSLRDCMVYSGE